MVAARLGYCDGDTGRAGCAGYRLLTVVGKWAFCVHCYPHRKRIVKILERKGK